MPDCPQSLSDFHRRFPSGAECAAWLFAVRWPDGFGGDGDARLEACADDVFQAAWLMATQ